MSRFGIMRKGSCPGALRPMASGDGLIVRVRPDSGVFRLRNSWCWEKRPRSMATASFTSPTERMCKSGR